MRLIVLFWLVMHFTLPGSSQVGPWRRHVIDASHSGADGVRLADANDDGLLDIATGWEEGGYTKVYLHPGRADCHKPWPGVIVGRTPNVEDAVFADIDGDGNMDVISCSEGNTRMVFINWAPSSGADYLDSSQWVTTPIPVSRGVTQWMYALPLQVDGRHGIDLIVGGKNTDAAVGWLAAPKNPRNMHAWQWYPISEATWIMSLMARDMDGDGDVDVAVSDRKRGPTQGVRWLENPGVRGDQRGDWVNHFIGGQGEEVMFIDMADLDGDGLEDVVSTATNQQIAWYKRLDVEGVSWAKAVIDIPVQTGRGKAVEVGDIDGDGIPDLAHSTNTLKEADKSGIMWLSRSDPSGEWIWRDVSGEVGYKYDRMELIDVDGDGDLDVITCEENHGRDSQGLGVIWFENPTIN